MAHKYYDTGAQGQVYDTAALTEDNELTLALKSLGALMISPEQCTVVTAHVRDVLMWHQRWQEAGRQQAGILALSREHHPRRAMTEGHSGYGLQGRHIARAVSMPRTSRRSTRRKSSVSTTAVGSIHGK